MLAHSVVEGFENENPKARKLQDELDALNFAFDQAIVSYPEAYAEAKVNLQPSHLNELDGILEQVSADMEHMDLKLRSENNRKKERNAVFTEEEELLEGLYDGLGRRLEKINPDGGAEQLKVDKVKIFRYNIVKMIYLLGGIALVSKTLYSLTQ